MAEKNIYFSFEGWDESIHYIPIECIQNKSNIIIILKEINKDFNNNVFITMHFNTFEKFMQYFNESIKSEKNQDLSELSSFRYITKPEKSDPLYSVAFFNSIKIIDKKIKIDFHIDGYEIPIEIKNKEVEYYKKELQDPKSLISQFSEILLKIERKQIEKMASANFSLNPMDLKAYSFDEKGNPYYDENKMIEIFLGYKREYSDSEYIFKSIPKGDKERKLFLIFSIESAKNFSKMCDIKIKKKMIEIDNEKERTSSGIDPSYNITFRD